MKDDNGKMSEIQPEQTSGNLVPQKIKSFWRDIIEASKREKENAKENAKAKENSRGEESKKKEEIGKIESKRGNATTCSEKKAQKRKELQSAVLDEALAREQEAFEGECSSVLDLDGDKFGVFSLEEDSLDPCMDASSAFQNLDLEKEDEEGMPIFPPRKKENLWVEGSPEGFPEESLDEKKLSYGESSFSLRDTYPPGPENWGAQEKSVPIDMPKRPTTSPAICLRSPSLYESEFGNCTIREFRASKGQDLNDFMVSTPELRFREKRAEALEQRLLEERKFLDLCSQRKRKTTPTKP